MKCWIASRIGAPYGMKNMAMYKYIQEKLGETMFPGEEFGYFLLRVWLKIKDRPNQHSKALIAKNFFASMAWRILRYKALKLYGRKCFVCANGPHNGKVIHVDHIKPRSLFPELALDINNLQILCEDCNMGKRNFDSIDWRPELKIYPTFAIDSV